MYAAFTARNMMARSLARVTNIISRATLMAHAREPRAWHKRANAASAVINV